MGWTGKPEAKDVGSTRTYQQPVRDLGGGGRRASEPAPSSPAPGAASAEEGGRGSSLGAIAESFLAGSPRRVCIGAGERTASTTILYETGTQSLPWVRLLSLPPSRDRCNERWSEVRRSSQGKTRFPSNSDPPAAIEWKEAVKREGGRQNGQVVERGKPIGSCDYRFDQRRVSPRARYNVGN
jgi:hypothetical protein